MMLVLGNPAALTAIGGLGCLVVLTFLIVRLSKVREERLKISTIAEASNDAIISKNLDGVISTWNSAAQRIFGYTPDEAIGQPIAIIIPPDLHDEEKDIMRRLRAGERVEHFETNRLTKDGRRIDVSIGVYPVKDKGGRIVSAVKISRDVTEKKKSEAAVRETEERFRLAMNNVAAGLYTLDLQGLVTYVNPAAETMFGWTNAELLGRKMHDVTHYKHPDGTTFPANECPGLQILEKGIEIREHEDVFIRKDGSFFPVVFSASPLKRDGNTVGIVVGFRDNTMRREADRAMRESEERFRLVANAAPVMIWMSGVDKQCMYFNQCWLEYTGKSFESELGGGWAEGVHPEDMKRCLATYNEAFDRREPFRMEYRLRRHDGEFRWILDHGVPRFNVDGSFAGYIGSCIDVTERKLAEETLSLLSQKLIEAQEQERSRLARELHDDITQRTAALALHINFLKQRVYSSTPRSMESLLNDAFKQAEDLTSDIQALSHRLHSSKLEYLGLSSAAGGFCKELAERQGVMIDFHAETLPEKLQPEIALCLFRVLQEALQNAIKHSGVRQFHVALRAESGEIILTVSDFGIGFEPDQAILGRGLGLTSMKERLKLVGGQLSIDSKPQRGTTIQARVPLTPRHPRLNFGSAATA
jgi:PAS domain S-box-containing protein